MSMDYEKLGLFYLGQRVDPDTQREADTPLLYDASDLVTHAVILGMTGSGKTGLGIGLIEEAAMDGIPVLAIDPKGDLSNLLLTFPELQAADLQPWVNPDEARLQGITVAAFAEREAAKWRDGLAQSGQPLDRIARLRTAAEFGVYTPGSRAARPLSVLRTFAAPAASVMQEPELLAERASGAALSVLTLAGINAEPLRSREHILLTTLLSEGWRQGHSLDLPALIQHVQAPPFPRVGVLELESFYPAGERFKLASDLNRLLAAPNFAVWLEGDPLDVQSLLYTAAGHPRITVLSIAHLADHERMFFVSLVLNEIVSWMRLQRGTSTLRAMIYIDEMMGYLPPVATPPSKPPLLTLLKQARAFGLGMTLATQNPVDLDYKALANAGTWFLGRLQTERDKARLLDGLEGAQAAAGHGFDRATTDRILSALPKRTFLLHNVHEPAPVLFKTRWTMSYLRGPLGRDELARLSANFAADGATVGNPRTSSAPTFAPVGATAGKPSAPVLDPSIPQFFAPGDGTTWLPFLAGAARVEYSEAKLKIHETRDITVLTPVLDGPVAVDWEHAEPAAFSSRDLSRTPRASLPFAPLPAAATVARNYPKWTKELTQWIAHTQTLELLHSPTLKVTSHVDEPERDFRIRLDMHLREERDHEVARVRDRHASKLATLDDRLRRAQAAVSREEQQAGESKLQAGVSMAATIFGAMLGRKAISATTLGRATSTARGVGRIGREAQDVARAKAELDALTAKREELVRAMDEELHAIAARWNLRDAPLERVLVKPKRGGTTVQLVALVWVPRS
jgi:hypothetical protein